MLGWAPEQGLEGERVGPEHKSQHLSERGEMEEKPFHNGPQWNSSCKEWKYRQKYGGLPWAGLLILGWQQEMEFQEICQVVPKSFTFFTPFPNLPPKLNQNGTWSIPSQEVEQKSPIEHHLVQKIQKETKLKCSTPFSPFSFQYPS